MNQPSALPSTAAEEVLRRWIGLDPHSIGEAAIRRAVRLRMLSLGLDDIQTFVRLVETDRTERDRLVEEVDIREIVRRKVEALSPARVEELLLAIMKKQLKFIEFVAGVLGFVIGVGQVVLTIYS
jgi:hypothetical protein